MGGQLSANYNDVKQIRTVGCYKIFSGVHKTTNERVSLWIVDQDLLKAKFPDKSMRNTFLDNEIASIQAIRKIRHPHVIKVMEYLDKKPEIGFASETIDDMDYLDTNNMHPLDASYISYQIAETLSFINAEAHVLHLGLCPQAVMVDKELNVHLMKFEFATPIINAENIEPTPQLLADAKSKNSNNYIRPPEFLRNYELSPTSDVFVFGLFLYKCFTGKDLYSSGDPQQILNNLYSYTSNMTGVPEEFKYILQQCLSEQPVQRPVFSRILEDPAFNSMQMKSLRYIDMILTKQPQDKFKFYKGLGSKIDYFSPSIQRVKILPKLLEECKNDVRFAPILLASIFMISKDYDARDFQENVWNKIAFLSGIQDPPEIAIALLRNMWLLLKKLDIRLHKDYVYPVFFTALQNKNTKVHVECLEKVDLIIDEMNDQAIQSTLIPRLMDLVSNSTDIHVSASALRCIAKCLDKSDSESFINDYFGRLQEVWQRRSSEQTASSILEICRKLKGSPDVMMIRVVPLLCIISGGHILRDDVRKEFCNNVISIATQMRDFKETIASTTTTQQDPDNPFATNKVITAANTASDIFGSGSANAAPQVNKVTAANTDDDIFGDLSTPKPSPTSSVAVSISLSNTPAPAPAPVAKPPPSTNDAFDPFSSSFIGGSKPANTNNSQKPPTIDFSMDTKPSQPSTSVFDRPSKPTTSSGSGIAVFDSSMRKVEDNPFDFSSSPTNTASNNSPTTPVAAGFGPNSKSSAKDLFGGPSTAPPPPKNDFGDFSSQPKPQNSNISSQKTDFDAFASTPKPQNTFNAAPKNDFGDFSPKPSNPAPKQNTTDFEAFASSTKPKNEAPKPQTSFGDFSKPQNTFNSVIPSPRPSNPFNDDFGSFNNKPAAPSFNAQPSPGFNQPQTTGFNQQPKQKAPFSSDGFSYSGQPGQGNFAGTFEFPSSNSGNFEGTFDFPSNAGGFGNQSFDFSNNSQQKPAQNTNNTNFFNF
ncbi:protein kinase, putative [Trichomonas vaginalis G3]|uniref:Protein kinase, putative n=1 Tax=Trichomonas vaginalis (strain ATCC PRA-98 / G3) TaxID=412133 RepID=A2FF51_TRIV3|nr:SCY1-related S/T protein kinase-like family [Trichomonas vaginalis G3]EAX96464.1 protein kinase, putative [Trichomonas vaginalis G3]KAI5503327.1 SCY1-related S/T protein kinase-like family [Trichomonas vaginalis G3]|eukprot:XP_001309394.1 protein kinase [Trichomonas vaginalis G3]